MTERVTATTKPYTIGRPPFRPGEDADFGGKFTEQPGDLHRPDPITCTAQDTVAHASGLLSNVNFLHHLFGQKLKNSIQLHLYMLVNYADI